MTRDILLVEGNDTTRDILRDQLKAEFNCSVTIATNGMRALEEVQAGRFALVVSNVRMPGLDGIDLLRRMRVYDRTAHIPFLMVETNPSPGVKKQIEEIRTKRGGAVELIGKTSLDPVLNAAERLLNQSNQWSEVA